MTLYLCIGGEQDYKRHECHSITISALGQLSTRPPNKQITLLNLYVAEPMTIKLRAPHFHM